MIRLFEGRVIDATVRPPGVDADLAVAVSGVASIPGVWWRLAGGCSPIASPNDTSTLSVRPVELGYKAQS